MGADGRNETILGEMALGLEAKYRDLALESVYEYGSRAGIWRLQRLLDARGVPVTVFAGAVALERNPQVAAWLRDSAHEICSHGWRWEEVWKLSREEERAHIAAAVASFEASCGRRPRGWYCRYGPSVHTRELLVEEGGFEYDADAYNDDLPYFVQVGGKPHLVVPYTFTYNDARFVAGTGYGSPADFLDNLRRGFDQLWDEGASAPRMMSIGLHPRLVGQASPRAGRVPRPCAGQGRGLVRHAAGYRPLVAGAPQGVHARAVSLRHQRHCALSLRGRGAVLKSPMVRRSLGRSVGGARLLCARPCRALC
jgi:peptidoglycan/xylan/chitin deacetylase (PgdA/CDA1 family)